MMNILHVVGGKFDGGAARGALYLSNALREFGVDSRIVCADPGPVRSIKGVSSVAEGGAGRIASFIRAKAESLPLRMFPKRDGRLFSLGISGIHISKLREFRECDIVHLHWINRGMVSIEGISEIEKPCVWTLRDMWPFTGGCHYAMDCKRYEEGCGRCPALGSSRENDLSSWVVNRKCRHFREDVVYVGISEWIAECARNSSLLGDADIRMVPNAIDTKTFRPIPKEKARERLGLPLDRPILLHGAIHLSDSYKGSALIEQAKQRLAGSSIFTCTFGTIDTANSVSGDRHFSLVKDDNLLRCIYSAADVLAFPSVQEAFGKVPAEAMACGTPAVVFDHAGPSEIVAHKVTGYLAKPFSIDDFVDGIRWILHDRSRLEKLSAAAAEASAQRFDPLLSAKRYLDIYREKFAPRGSLSGP